MQLGLMASFLVDKISITLAEYDRDFDSFICDI